MEIQNHNVYTRRTRLTCFRESCWGIKCKLGTVLGAGSLRISALVMCLGARVTTRLRARALPHPVVRDWGVQVDGEDESRFWFMAG